ncbi:MAG: tetraacyldisaccharide 4'-kinase [Deltaproteobacteria bacterium]|nr:tetraacyldisaccharide 4'-kinase [Deltaproteobacteria bacterium]NIS78191.1 tetraacyldisaccharide 4'-kinase [Deltaproteobacteria bacterium]
MLFLYNTLVRELTERGVFKKFVPSHPVLSVGNISFGGTGKTPHVICMANYLIDRGKRVCVLTRGYKRKGAGYRFFRQGEVPESVEAVGDEPFLLKKRVPGITMCVGESRHESMDRVLREEEVDLFLLDDGFQQFRLAKSFDAVLLRYRELAALDIRAKHFMMRESPLSLRHADFIVITKVPAPFECQNLDFPGSRYLGEVERAYTRYRVSCVSTNAGNGAQDWKGVDYFLFGGVADFSGLLDTAREHGIVVGGFLPLPDHVDYSERTMERIRHLSRGRTLLTSEKDIVKLPYERFGEIHSISVDVEFLRGKEQFLGRVLAAAEGV